MVIVRLMGGLGNQMFQYATGRALADQRGCDLCLDLRNLKRDNLRDYQLSHYGVRAEICSSSELLRWPYWARKIIAQLPTIGLRRHWYSEPSFTYSEIRDFGARTQMLDGYFQSERYFKFIADRLKQEFSPRMTLPNAMEQIAQDIRVTNSVSIHVRAGDYMSDPGVAAVHGVCSKEYYRQAIDIMRDRVLDPKFFVFSDDMKWARTILDLPVESVWVEGNHRRPEVDIHLMSLCQHQIIANSSFSWWGAWLGSVGHAGGQIVIAPEPWFNDARLPDFDLVPERWVRLPK